MTEESGFGPQQGAGSGTTPSYPSGNERVQRPKRDANHSPSSRAEIKIVWNYTSTPPYVFVAPLLYVQFLPVGCFATLSVATLYRIAGWLIQLKGFRRRGRGLFQALSRNLPRRTQETHEKNWGQPASWPKYELRASQIQAYSITLCQPARSICQA
jgi:hypothetical protein